MILRNFVTRFGTDRTDTRPSAWAVVGDSYDRAGIEPM